MSEKCYRVANSPIAAVNGEYWYDNGKGVHRNVNGKFEMSPQKHHWVITSIAERKPMCKVSLDVARPQFIPPSGWQYYEEDDLSWFPASNMVVERFSAGAAAQPAGAPASIGRTATSQAADVAPLPPSPTGAAELVLNGLKPSDFGWVFEDATYWSAASYVNTRTGAKITTMPDGQVCSYAVTANNAEGQTEVFAPTIFATHNKRHILQSGFYERFDDYAPFWAESVRRYEAEILKNQAELTDRKTIEASLSDESRRMQTEIASLEQQLENIKIRERTAVQKSDSVVQRVGRSHIKRDWQQSRVGSSFPAGEDLRSMFLERFLEFESFACDAVNCLEDLSVPNPTYELVHQVMIPIYKQAIRHVSQRLEERRNLMQHEFGLPLSNDGEDTIAKLFWYSTQQNAFFQEINTLVTTGAADVKTMLYGMSPFINSLHKQMVEQGEAGNIANEPNSIRLDKLLGTLLLLQTVAALSDPPCYLQPCPGEKVKYKEGSFMEILSPGIKKHGRIKEGDVVEVVMCGLYFEDAAGRYDTVKPVVPSLVRRCVADA